MYSFLLLRNGFWHSCVVAILGFSIQCWISIDFTISFVSVCVYVCRYMHACMHMWEKWPEITTKCFSHSLSTLLLETRSLTEPWSLQIWLDWLTSKLQRPFWLSHNTRITGLYWGGQHLHGWWGSNSGPCASSDNILPAEPPLWPLEVSWSCKVKDWILYNLPFTLKNAEVSS